MQTATWGDSVPMEPTSDDSLSKWITGVVAIGLVALVAFLSKYVFGGVLDKLKSIEAKTDAIATNVSEIKSASTVQGRDIDRHEKDIKAVGERVEGLHRYWGEEFQQLRREMLELLKRE